MKTKLLYMFVGFMIGEANLATQLWLCIALAFLLLLMFLGGIMHDGPLTIYLPPSTPAPPPPPPGQPRKIVDTSNGFRCVPMGTSQVFGGILTSRDWLYDTSTDTWGLVPIERVGKLITESDVVAR